MPTNSAVTVLYMNTCSIFKRPLPFITLDIVFIQ